MTIIKKLTLASIAALLPLATTIASTADKPSDKKGETTVIETTNLCNEKGYRSTTPVRVVIADDKVVTVEALPNQETPRFFQRVIDNLLPLYNGVKVKKAFEMTSGPIPDGCTGATYSARAVQQNIKSALNKYKKNNPLPGNHPHIISQFFRLNA